MCRLCSLHICLDICFVFVFKQKTAYEMRISDWSSDVCSSDLSDFYEHTGYGSKAIDRAAAEQIAELTGRLETLPDVRALLPLIMSGPDHVPAKTQQI